MKFQTTTARNILAVTMTAFALVTISGCAVSRGQETVGAYIDDAGITTRVKAKFIEDKQVDASSISVETLNGTVMLSGFAKNGDEKFIAGNLARNISGVKTVRNEIVIRP